MNLFAEQAPKPERARPIPDLVVREALERDLEALGRIAAEREGGDPESHRTAFVTLLRDSVPAGDGRLLVAVMGDDVMGFGKVARFRHSLNAEAGLASDIAPEGWYLAGVVVSAEWRRRGVGDRLTASRLEWIARRATRAYYFVNARNTVSIDLHRRFGFIEVTRQFSFPGASFEGGKGILFEAELAPGGVAKFATCSGANGEGTPHDE